MRTYFSGLLIATLIFVALQVSHVVHWSWWAITAPLWGGTLLVLDGMLIGLGLLMIAAWTD